MPRASDELRNKMDEYFGDPIDLYGPLEYLKKNNWKDNRGLLVAPPRPITAKEWHCVDFLVGEWDFAFKVPRMI